MHLDKPLHDKPDPLHRFILHFTFLSMKTPQPTNHFVSLQLQQIKGYSVIGCNNFHSVSGISWFFSTARLAAKANEGRQNRCAIARCQALSTCGRENCFLERYVFHIILNSFCQALLFYRMNCCGAIYFIKYCLLIHDLWRKPLAETLAENWMISSEFYSQMAAIHNGVVVDHWLGVILPVDVILTKILSLTCN